MALEQQRTRSLLQQENKLPSHYQTRFTFQGALHVCYVLVT
jgi:hypothetical protein